ncbi:isochorismatase family protein [Natronoglycomyces albus]|uniref:nicotinamidase n=1 Tax=Natronoglycomyces albus TaxID=2811108 RepID=A0A895XRB0_9ACTN|nr:isochorismatase family protein [Natronoglycomyces albus]QSB05889.1 isochorismatase family protein [Natronoglycomyces albus]
MSNGRALIVVDVQKDFCEGGSLAVTGGGNVALAIKEFIAENEGRWDHVVATRDYHIDPGSHFSENPDFVDSWPPHCVVGTEGAQFHPNFDPRVASAIFDKGAYEAAYSGFEGHSGEEELASWLRGNGINTVEVVGLATDHCVRATAVDAAREGFTTSVLLNLTAGVNPDTIASALAQMRHEGVELQGEPVGA